MGLIIHSRDITECKRVEGELKKSEEQVRLLLNSIAEQFTALIFKATVLLPIHPVLRCWDTRT